MSATARQSVYAKMSPRQSVVHALTAYDRANAHRKSHNRFFIGIALNALHDAEADMPDASVLDLIEPFCGRVLGFLIRELGLSDVATVGKRGDLEVVS
jgi:hypothetical protein